MASAAPGQQRRASAHSKSSLPAASAKGNTSDSNTREASNAGYDDAVREGDVNEAQPDVFERLARVDGDVESGIADNLDPEELVAEMEGRASWEGLDGAVLDDLDEIATEEREWAGAEATANDSVALS